MEPNSSVQIVPMTRGDLSQVMAIEQASFPLPFSENLFHMELDLQIAHMMVAKAGETILGYLDFWHVEQEMRVINIAVHSQRRRAGIGSLLVQYLVDYGREHRVEQIYLDVRESNRAAVRLYEKFGFQKIDVRRGYYQDNQEDALVMEWRA